MLSVGRQPVSDAQGIQRMLFAEAIGVGLPVTVLRNGCEIFPAMLEAIRSATRSINFATYVYWTGSIAPEFAEALAERAEAGVEVESIREYRPSFEDVFTALVERDRDAVERPAENAGDVESRGLGDVYKRQLPVQYT